MDQLYQVFVDENSETKDIVIKMYHPGNEERFLCVDLPEKAIDFLPPSEYPPTRFALNIPACKITASSMEITSIERKTKVLTSRLETLRNATDKHREMVVEPPSGSVNIDGKSVFFDQVQIRPNTKGDAGKSEPMIVIGSNRSDDEHTISVYDQKATI